MIEISVVFQLSNGWVVQYGNTKYVLNAWDILFQDGHAYTYPSKLTQRY